MATWQDILNWAAGSTRANGLCQGFAGNDFTSAFGTFRVGYASANAAMAASKAAGTFHTGEPPANQVVWVFYAFPTYGHVGIAYNGTVLYDSTQVTAWVNAKHTVGTAPLHHYSYAYLGWASSNGANTIPVIPTPNVNTFGNNGVEVTNAVTNIRNAPSTSAAVARELAASAWFNSDGYTVSGQAVSGNTDWFHVAGGGWVSATVAAAANLAALPKLDADGTVYVAPPVVHTVTFNWNDSDADAPTNVTQQVTDGNTIVAPSIPTRNAYTFTDWTSDEIGASVVALTTPVTADITLYAQWTPVPVAPETPIDDTPPVTTDPTTPVTSTDPTTPVVPSKPVKPTKPVAPSKQSVISIILTALANFFKSFKFGNTN